MSTGRLRDQVAGRCWDQIIGRSKDAQRNVGQTCFLNSTKKRIKHTWAGYSRYYIEWEQKNQWKV